MPAGDSWIWDLPRNRRGLEVATRQAACPGRPADPHAAGTTWAVGKMAAPSLELVAASERQGCAARSSAQASRHPRSSGAGVPSMRPAYASGAVEAAGAGQPPQGPAQRHLVSWKRQVRSLPSRLQPSLPLDPPAAQAHRFLLVATGRRARTHVKEPSEHSLPPLADADRHTSSRLPPRPIGTQASPGSAGCAPWHLNTALLSERGTAQSQAAATRTGNRTDCADPVQKLRRPAAIGLRKAIASERSRGQRKLGNSITTP